jgi:hypothetical protein
MLAFDYPEKAIRNADNYGLFAASFLLHDSDPGHGTSREQRSQYILELENATRVKLPKVLPTYEEALLHVLGSGPFGTYPLDQAEADAEKICHPSTIPKKIIFSGKG